MATDGTDKDLEGPATIGRRGLLKLAATTAGVGLPLAAFLGRAPWRGPAPAKADEAPRVRESYWRGDYFVQENVDASRADEGVVRARLDGEWREFLIRELRDDFIDWNFEARIEMLSGSMTAMCLSGPHSACLATYGANRGDSSFTLNAAYKGFGFFPTPERIDECTETLRSHWSDSDSGKASVLRGFYRDRTMWDFRKLSSLELYTTQEFETHSFLNQMANPLATICWLAIPGSFEVRSIPRLIHPRDPGPSEIDRKRLAWVNHMHDFYHGGPLPDLEDLEWIGCIYYVVEVFDNSPYPGPMGVRTTPPL
jgi:hypothetical protein